MKRIHKINTLILICLVVYILPARTRIDTSVVNNMNVPGRTNSGGNTPGFNSAAYRAFTYFKDRAYPQQGTDALPFRLLVPQNYNKNANTKYPLFVMYHGRGEAGTDNNNQLIWGGSLHLAARNGPSSVMINGQTITAPRVDAFVFYPQEPYGSWTNSYQYNQSNPSSQLSTSMMLSWDVIDSLVLKYKIDRDRIYVHGLSSGGTATWASLYHRPDLFAAAQPMSTPGDTSRAKYVANIPIWLHQGAADDNPIPYYSYLMLDALKKVGVVDSSLKYSEYPLPIKHDTWLKAYTDPDFFPFFLRQSKRKIRILGTNPICSGESVALGFSYNYFEYQWYKDNLPLSGANAFRMENVNLAGNYYVRYKKTSGSIYEYSDTVTLTISPGALKPTIVASGSTLLPSPDANNVVLKGPKGYSLYEWSNGAKVDSVLVASNGSYTLRVRQDGQCWSVFSDPVLVKTGGNSAGTPAAPLDVTALPRSNRSILVGWTDNSSTETGFEIYRALSSQGPFKFVKLISANSVSYIDTLLNPNTRYYYKVRSVNENGGNLSTNIAYTNTYKDFVLPSAPTNPYIVSVDATGGIMLSWTASSDDIGIREYRVYNGGMLLGVTSTNSIRINPPSGLTYNFQIVAIDLSGNASVPSVVVPFKYDGAGVVVKYFQLDGLNNLPNFSLVSPLRYGLSSNFNTTGSSGTASLTNILTNSNIISNADNFQLSMNGYVRIPRTGNYRFYLTSDDGSKMWVNNQLIINNDGLHGNVTLTYDYNFTSTGWFPIQVDYFEKTGGQSLTVEWQKTTGSNTFGRCTFANTPSIDNNTVYLSFLNTGNVSNVAQTTPNGPGNINVQSIPSSVPSSPTGIDKPKIQVTWTQSADASALYYEIYRYVSSNSSTTVSSLVKIAQIPYKTNSFVYVDSVGNAANGFLEVGKFYFYGIRLVTSTGFSSIGTNNLGYGFQLSSNYNNISLPNIPVLNSVTSISNSIVNIAWTDNNTNESGTEIYRSSFASGPFYLVGKSGPNTSSFKDSSGIISSLYYYKIRAYNFKGFSGYSGVLSTTTLNKPNAPEALTASVAGPQSINLSWVVTDDIAFGFSIFRSTDNVNFTKIDSIPNPGLNAYQDKNLNSNTTYYYKVRAYNNYKSDFSQVVSAKTLGAFTPSSADWRLPIVLNSLSYNFESTKYSNSRNLSKLKDSLEAKRDMLSYIYLGDAEGNSKYFQFQLPAASEFPNGGMLIYNIAETVDAGTDTNRFAIGNNGNQPYPNNNLENGFFTLKVELSNSSSFGTIDSTKYPFVSARNAQLQKVQFPSTWANKFVRLTFTKKATSTARTMWLTEVGLYKFLGSGVRHNYFVITGASIEEPNTPMGLSRFRRLMKNIPELKEQSKNMVVFNLAKAGSNSFELRDSIDKFLNRHPYASYVGVHQGGNNINSAYNNMRPLTFDRLGNPNALNFVQSMTDIINVIYSKNKIPYVSRLHFRDYGKENTCKPDNVKDFPFVNYGRNQENGSLPLNLLIDSLTRKYTPYAYSETERRSLLNFYPTTLNRQALLGGDGIHIAESQANTDSIAMYWVQNYFRHVYTNSFSVPKVYNPDFPNFQSWHNCAGIPPANKPKLDSLTNVAVQKALFTKSGNDIWEARILVEQLGDKNTRVPYVLMLDSLRDYRSPNTPTDLTVNSVDNTSIILNWIDLSGVESAYLVYRSINGGPYSILTSLPSNTITFTDINLSASNEYSYYVRAINGTFKSGISNIVKVRPSVIYYLKSNGAVSLLNSWGRQSDGTGTVPTDFSAAGQTFVVANRVGVAEINSDLNINGLYSKIIVQESQSLKVNQGVTLSANLELKKNSKLILFGLNLPNFVSIDSTSILVLGNDFTLPSNGIWGNLEIESGKNVNLPSGATSVKGNLSLKSNASLIGSNSRITLKGNLVYSDSTSSLNNVGLTLVGKNQNLDAKNGSIKVNSFQISENDTVKLLNASKIVVQGTSLGDSTVLANSSKLVLGPGKLIIKGYTSLNRSNQSGIIATNGGGVYINTISGDNSNLWLSELPYENQIGDFIVDIGNLNDTLILRNPLIINKNLKVASGVFKSNNVLSMVNDYQSSARLLKVGANAKFQDSLLFENYIGPNKKQGTHYIASPIKNRKLKEWKSTLPLRFTASASDVRVYDEANQYWSYILDTNTVVQSGKGYAVFVLQSSFDSSMSAGVPFYNKGIPMVGNGNGNNISNFEIPISRSSSAGGWNLVANPYPCELDWTNVSGWDKTQISNTIYMWDGYSRKYSVYHGNTNTRINGGDSIIPTGQAFFVRKSAIGSGILGINEDSKVYSNPSYKFYRKAASPIFRKLYISVSDGGAFDQTVLVFGDGLSEEVDDEDAIKYNGQVINVYTIMQESQLALQCLPSLYSKSIPLGVSAKAGSYYFNFTDQELFYKLSSLKLYDSYLNQTIDLLSKPYYNFDITSDPASFGNNRFVLNYEWLEVVTGLHDGTVLEDLKLFPNPFEDNLYLNIKSMKSQNVKIDLTDLEGRHLKTLVFDVNEGENVINVKRYVDFDIYGKGVFLMKTYLGGMVYSTKLIYK